MKFSPSMEPYRILRFSLFLMVALLHIIALVHFKVNIAKEDKEEVSQAEVIKLVDFQEYIPPPPREPEPEKKILQLQEQPPASEKIIPLEDEVEIARETPVSRESPVAEFLPQHKISRIPEIPGQEILNRIVYPPMALRQGVEGVVYVELYIDSTGIIRKIIVLKDPGRGFAEAAVKALKGIVCRPAEANGTPVPVKYRYPIRFVLN